MYVVNNSVIHLGGRFGQYMNQQQIVMAHDYYVISSDDVKDNQFVILTMDPRAGYTPYNVYIVQEHSGSYTGNPLHGRTPRDWIVHYDQYFRVFADAVNGMEQPISRYDKMYDQAKPWIPGFFDCVYKP